MQTVAEELITKTQIYWKLSQVWNGRRKAEIQTGEAISFCTSVQSITNYNRPLFHAVDSLLQELITGEGHKIVTPKILKLARS